MDQSKVWGLPRYVTLLVVLAVHGALLALLMTSGSRNVSLSTNVPVELVFLRPATAPKIRSENARPHGLSGDTAISIAPPVLESVLPSASPLAPGSDGNGSGSGVDWAAEARRAIQAFEIRKHQPASNSSVSGSPAEQNWWPRVKHHAGDQFKTASGDWIVWINASCYQVASSAMTYAPGAALPQTICPGDSRTPR
jgi:hypothetical protein